MSELPDNSGPLIERHDRATVHNGWSVTTSHGVVVCSTKAQAERIAQLLEMHGWIATALSMPPDPFVSPDAVFRVPLWRRRRWWWG